jgi:preprotein translocase subunit SecE
MGIFSEIKKVTWPTKKQVISNTLSVLAFCLFVGAIIWLADLGLKSLLNYISGAN